MGESSKKMNEPAGLSLRKMPKTRKGVKYIIPKHFWRDLAEAPGARPFSRRYAAGEGGPTKSGRGRMLRIRSGMRTSMQGATIPPAPGRALRPRPSSDARPPSPARSAREGRAAGRFHFLRHAVEGLDPTREGI